jgi:chemotaxis regulatin CheY-phosphate phosphatase CheZ
MKLYCWRHKSYGEEAFVMAEDEDAARRALLATRIPLPTEPKPLREEMNRKHNLWHAWFNAEWHNEKVRDMLSGDNHKLVVLEAGQVAWAEVS